MDPHYQSSSPKVPPKKSSLPMRYSKESNNSTRIKQRSKSLVMASQDPAVVVSDSRIRKAVDLKRGKLVDKTKEPPFVGLRRNNSLTKEEKQEVNLRRKESDTAEAQKLMTLVVAGDVVGASKVRKTMSNQKRRIRRRHTVGGTKDFAEWEAMMYNQENDKNLYNLQDPETPYTSGKQSAYAMEGISNCTVDEAAEMAAIAAASRILERQRAILENPSRRITVWEKKNLMRSNPDLVLSSRTSRTTKESMATARKLMLERRLSLPESYLDNDLEQPSGLLESQV